MMGTQYDKVRENRLRRWAKRLGMMLRRSRVRRIHIDNLGGYMLVDISRNFVVDGSRFELELDDVEASLTRLEQSLAQ
jgi:hypothetical protein